MRAAVAEALGSVDARVARPLLRRLLVDDAFFVRSHAARAVAKAGDGMLAGKLLPLLADQNWWVRAAAKESLSLCQVKLGEMSKQLSSETQALRTALVAIRDLSAAFKPGLQDLEDSITRRLAPFHNSEHEARLAARETPMLNSFVGTFMARSWGGRHDVTAEAGEAIKHLDAILAGQCPWQWQGKAGCAEDSATGAVPCATDTGTPSADDDAAGVASEPALATAS